jgi:hypothetical protein
VLIDHIAPVSALGEEEEIEDLAVIDKALRGGGVGTIAKFGSPVERNGFVIPVSWFRGMGFERLRLTHVTIRRNRSPGSVLKIRRIRRTFAEAAAGIGPAGENLGAGCCDGREPGLEEADQHLCSSAGLRNLASLFAG